MASMHVGASGGTVDSIQATIKHLNFTQDLSSLTVVTKAGYRFYCLNSVDELVQTFSCDEDGDLLLVERLYSSALLAIVGSKSPYKLRLHHYKKGTEICSYTYTGKILSVKLNRKRLIVCLEDSLYIHNIMDMKVLHTIRDTPPNVIGLFALATPSVNNERQSYLAYPGSSHSGVVNIFDTINLRAVNSIKAHNNSLVAIAFNVEGSLIASASEKGTVIRVFNVENSERLYEFRRGVKRCADIYSLSFSLDSAYLSCSSNTETVHVFKLHADKEHKGLTESQGWYDYFGQALKSSTSYLPTTVSDVLSQGRYFAVARLPVAGIKNICAVCNIQKQPQLLVATADGRLYVYNLDVQEGGECSLLTQHRIDDSSEPVSSKAEEKPSVATFLSKTSEIVNGISDLVNFGSASDSETTKSNTNSNSSTAVNEVYPADSASGSKLAAGSCEDMIGQGSEAAVSNCDRSKPSCDADEGSRASRCKTRKSSNTSTGSSDSGLQWADCLSRKSYASVVQTAGSSRCGPPEDQDEGCSGLQDLEEAAQFEDALSDDAYSPEILINDSSLRITDSTEFPSVDFTRKTVPDIITG